MKVVAVLISIVTISTAAATKRPLDHDWEPQHSTVRTRLSLALDFDSTTPTTRPGVTAMSQTDAVTSSSALSGALVSNDSNETIFVYLIR